MSQAGKYWERDTHRPSPVSLITQRLWRNRDDRASRETTRRMVRSVSSASTRRLHDESRRYATRIRPSSPRKTAYLTSDLHYSLWVPGFQAPKVPFPAVPVRFFPAAPPGFEQACATCGMYNLGDVLPASAIGKMKAPIRLIENSTSSRRWPRIGLYALERTVNPSNRYQTSHYIVSTRRLQNICDAADARLSPVFALRAQGAVASARHRRGVYE
jgi:hypothetical protein